jgi:hypothetical protein
MGIHTVKEHLLGIHGNVKPSLSTDPKIREKMLASIKDCLIEKAKQKEIADVIGSRREIVDNASTIGNPCFDDSSTYSFVKDPFQYIVPFHIDANTPSTSKREKIDGCFEN